MSTLVIVLIALVGVAAVVVALFLVRRRSLSRGSSSFDCSVFVDAPSKRGNRWRLGVAMYGQASVEWFPMFSFGRRPALTLPRRELEIDNRRDPSEEEQFAVQPGAVVLDCTLTGKSLNLAMSPDAAAGLSSWLESAPPGDNARMGHFA